MEIYKKLYIKTTFCAVKQSIQLNYVDGGEFVTEVFIRYSCILFLVCGLQRDDFKCLYREVMKSISQQEISCSLLERILKNCQVQV